jgi:Family of unknown function (DUF5309)
MALASTAFMAAPGAWTSTLANKLDKIDCSQVLAAVLNADTALLGHIKMGPARTNIEINWIEDELNAAYVIASSSASNVCTITSPTATSDRVRILRKNCVIQPAGGEMCLQITGTLTTAKPTAAAYGSTTWSAWTATRCYVIAMPYADIDDASSDRSKSRAKRKNFMQVFERAVEITQSRKGLAMEAVTDDMQLQIKYRTLEMKRELNLSVIRGYARATAGNTPSADHELRTMAGIIQLIRDYDLDTTNEDDLAVQASAALTVGHINSLAYKIFDAGGLDEGADPIIVVPPNQARIISAMDKDIRRIEQGERQVGYYKNVFLSDLGVEMPVVVDRWMPKDKLIILDRSRIMLCPLTGDAWHMEKMAKTGRNEKWQLSGQYTLELRNAAQCHGVLYDLS